MSIDVQQKQSSPEYAETVSVTTRFSKPYYTFGKKWSELFYVL
jgi:hypothetical protein